MPSPLIKFLPYQQKWLDDDSRFKIGMFARQTGKTFTNSAAIVKDCLQQETDGKTARWVILSRGERQAKEMMDTGIKPMVKAFYELKNAQMPKILENNYKTENANYRALEVELPGGSKITALPANPDTARGFSANVFLDEFAFHQNSLAIWQALFPVIPKPGLKIRIASTPNGKANKFYELMTSKDDEWSRHIVDIYQAVNMGLDRDLTTLKKAIGDEDAWAQEFELEWMDEAHSWISFDLIMSCETNTMPAITQKPSIFMGIDVAIRKDLWVLVILEKQGDVLYMRDIIAKKGIKFAQQEHILATAVQQYKPTHIAIDQTGMGEQITERAKQAYGETRVEGVLFSAPKKLDMASLMKQKFQDRRIRIPAGDQKLRADLHAIKMQPSISGAPRLVADGKTDGHADRFWAIALAISAAETAPFNPYGYQGVRGAASDITGNTESVWQQMQGFW